MNSTELLIHIDIGDFVSGLAVIKKYGYDFQDLKNTKEKNINTNREDFVFLYNCFIVYFGVGNYSAALFYLNQILINAPTNYRNDILCNARIASLVVHYELGNEDLLPYLIKSIYRFLSKRDRVYEREKIIFDLIQKGMLKVKSMPELIKVFAKAKSQIEMIKVEEEKSLDGFNLLAWLESKIKRKPFAEVVKQSARKNE